MHSAYLHVSLKMFVPGNQLTQSTQKSPYLSNQTRLNIHFLSMLHVRLDYSAGVKTTTTKNYSNFLFQALLWLSLYFLDFEYVLVYMCLLQNVFG